MHQPPFGLQKNLFGTDDASAGETGAKAAPPTTRSDATATAARLFSIPFIDGFPSTGVAAYGNSVDMILTTNFVTSNINLAY